MSITPALKSFNAGAPPPLTVANDKLPLPSVFKTWSAEPSEVGIVNAVPPDVIIKFVPFELIDSFASTNCSVGILPPVSVNNSPLSCTCVSLTSESTPKLTTDPKVPNVKSSPTDKSPVIDTSLGNPIVTVLLVTATVVSFDTGENVKVSVPTVTVSVALPSLIDNPLALSIVIVFVAPPPVATTPGPTKFKTVAAVDKAVPSSCTVILLVIFPPVLITTPPEVSPSLILSVWSALLYHKRPSSPIRVAPSEYFLNCVLKSWVNTPPLIAIILRRYYYS